jgi:hypothetical protein
VPPDHGLEGPSCRTKELARPQRTSLARGVRQALPGNSGVDTSSWDSHRRTMCRVPPPMSEACSESGSTDQLSRQPRRNTDRPLCLGNPRCLGIYASGNRPPKPRSRGPALSRQRLPHRPVRHRDLFQMCQLPICWGSQNSPAGEVGEGPKHTGSTRLPLQFGASAGRHDCNQRGRRAYRSATMWPTATPILALWQALSIEVFLDYRCFYRDSPLFPSAAESIPASSSTTPGDWDATSSRSHRSSGLTYRAA